MMENETKTPLLSVKGLKQYFKVSSSYTVHAVEGVSFDIYPGETYGLVGESGSGKSTIGRSIIRLYDPTDGTILFNGMDISKKMSRTDTQALRTQMQMIFQDPMASLNPRKKVIDIVAEGLDANHMYKTKEEREQKVFEILEKVGLNHEQANRYPHMFSGGQRQRVGIARAMVMEPEIIIADECISALDVSIQAQVVNMFEELQEKLGVAYLFIAHDLLVVHHISNRIAVMYLGKMMEIADADELNSNPIHPYTLSLLSAVPIPDPETARHSKRIVLEGDVPSPLKMPTGCPFRTRCKYATEQCAAEMPQLTDRGSGHFVACWNK